MLLVKWIAADKTKAIRFPPAEITMQSTHIFLEKSQIINMI